MKKTLLTIASLILVLALFNISDNRVYAQTFSVVEDAEDGNIEGWSVYDNIPAGALIENVSDIDKASRVIKTIGCGGFDNGFSFNLLDICGYTLIKWDMKAWDVKTYYRIYIKVQLKTGEIVYLTYDPWADTNRSYRSASGHYYIFHILETSVRDSLWHTVELDLEADLHDAGIVPGFEGFENKSIDYITSFLIRGNYMLDNIAVGSASTASAIPHLIRFQGAIGDGEKIPLQGEVTLNITFKIYDVESGGAHLWAETQNLTIEDSLLDVELGSITPLDLAFDTQYYLGVEVEQDGEMTPRFKLTSVPYAFVAEQ